MEVINSKSRVFFSLNRDLQIFWLPYNYAFFIIFLHVTIMISLGKIGIIPLFLSLIFFIGIGIQKTKGDHNWFNILASSLLYYQKHLANFFKTKITYHA